MTWTLLHHACEHLDSKCIFERCKTSTNELLEVDDHGSTPLHILAWGNPDLKLLGALTACCPAASLSDKDVHGDTCLHVACSYPRTDVKVVQLLHEACPLLVSTTNREGLMPLHVACRFAPENAAVIKFLMEVYPCALRKPIKMGDPAPKRKPKPGKESPHPDHFVSRDDGTNFSEIRFQSMSTQVRDGAYPLHMAVQSGAPRSVLTMIIQAAEDVLLKTNKFGETPLHVALARNVEDDVIDLLVEHESQALRVKDTNQNLPLHVAAAHGCSVRVAKTLLQQYPSSLQEKNRNGKTPFELALETGNSQAEVIRLLETKDLSEVGVSEE